MRTDMRPYTYLVRLDDQPDRETVYFSTGNEIAIEYGRTLLEDAQLKTQASCAVAFGKGESDEEWLGVWDWTPERGAVWTTEEDD